MMTNDGRPVLRMGKPPEQLCEDKILQWHDNRWYHYGSSESYRGEVPFFIGPLPRINRPAVLG